MQKQDTRNERIGHQAIRSSGHQSKINPLKELYKAGQSPWYDNIERKLFKTGEFRRLIDEYGIVGVTSNPTIFDRAISGSRDYDGQIKDLVKKGKNSRQIYNELAADDVAAAADMLSDVYKRSKGVDGYVSIEVLPEYAYDSKKTVEYAKEIFSRIGRENILIKVPGTKEGLPAIKELISGGISVNATLLFSVSHYEAAARAYIDGLKERLKNGGSLGGVTSVASVFVSRVDTRIDKMLEEPGRGRDMRGKAAIANSKMIYRKFRDIFMSGEFSGLAEKGANIQRALWASTSTKNPDYRDVIYVEELIGPRTVNTMPPQTLLAFYDHGVVKNTVGQGAEGAAAVIAKLKSIGIDVNEICGQLQTEGVKAFCDSFDSLISSIEKKMNLLK